MIYYLIFFLFMVGLYCVVVKKNLVKIIIGVVIMEYALHLFIILLGYREKGIPPIIDASTNLEEFTQVSVDPLPQALVLTSIVISLGVLALMVSLAIRIYERYGTFDLTKIKRLKG